MTPSLEVHESPIRVMTFNIRFDTIVDEDSGDRWKDRVASVVETVDRFDPHLVGFQEALKPQLQQLTDAFPRYTALGRPRDVGDTAEYVPLFVDRRRFNIQDSGDFWLSPTPEMQGSRGWDTDVPRHSTWARLEDEESGHRFAIFNTHLDVKGEVARFEAAKLIVTRVSLAPELPSLVMGDFNAPEDSRALDILRTSGFRDTFRVLHPDATDVQTIHHYVELSGPRKIDYIMCDGRWEIVRAEILREPAAGRLPSDHYPVVAEVVPKAKPTP